MFVKFEQEKQKGGLHVGVPTGINAIMYDNLESAQNNHKPEFVIYCNKYRSKLENKLYIEDVLTAMKLCGIIDDIIYYTKEK